MVSLKRVSRPIRETLLWRWNITPERIDELKKDFEALGSIEIKFYKSTFKTWSIELEVNRSELSTVDNSNHVDIFLDNNLILQFLERYSICAGALFEDAIPDGLEKKIEHSLREHGYRIGKKENARHKRYGFWLATFTCFLNAFVWTFGFLLLREYYIHKYIDKAPREILEVFFPGISPFYILMGILWFSAGIIWVFRIMKTSFKE